MKALLACLCVLLLSGTAQAKDNDDDFEKAVRNFGYTSGLAHQCTPEGQKLTVEKDVLKAYTGLVALFGSDEAFFYAAAFGAGSTASYDTKKCKEYLEEFKALMQRGKPEKPGKPGKPEKYEKPGKPEKYDKPEKSEKPKPGM